MLKLLKIAIGLVRPAAAEDTIRGCSLMENADLQSRKMMGSNPSTRAIRLSQSQPRL